MLFQMRCRLAKSLGASAPHPDIVHDVAHREGKRAGRPVPPLAGARWPMPPGFGAGLILAICAGKSRRGPGRLRDGSGDA
ncbi:hypothetical protein BG57_15730 [Caballeronia grimmiae]|uniref:Uncharacterized protein n=1 Tax=Caballeronia grimmiae TaxID=1071679 RepID=A0A069NXP7_9BURK|nr:hypothetical protein BG57_15730 [Caballeronia grimmiae]